MKSFLGDVYGEITNKGTDVLLETFSEYFNNPKGVFYDLGSGNGNLSIYIASKTPLKKVCGIELHTERYNTSKENSKDLKLDHLSFIESDFTKCDLSDATVIYIDNLVMPKDACNRFYKNLTKGCLVISTKRIHIFENKKDYFRTSIVEKTYTKKRTNWYIIKKS